MELQLQVTEEELLEFPEVRSDQFNTSHSDKPAGTVVLSIENSAIENRTIENRTEESCTEESSIEKNSTEKKSSLSSSRSHGKCSANTHSRIKVEKPYYK